MELASGKLMDQAVSIQYFKKSFYSYYLFVISFYLLLFVQLNILLYLISRILGSILVMMMHRYLSYSDDVFIYGL